MVYLTNKEGLAVYYTVVKYDRHFRTREKCRKHELECSQMTGVFYRMQSNTQLRLPYLLYDIEAICPKTKHALFLCFML